MDGNRDSFSFNRVSKLFSFTAFQGLMLILTGLVAFCFLVELPSFLHVTGENVYPESAGVLAALRWANGLPLYGDYRQPPYLVTAFPPLWYAFLALAVKAGIAKLDALTLFGRILSLASVFGIAVIGFRWNQRLTHSRWSAVLTPAFYLSFPILIPWAVTARPDLPALFLGLLALYWSGFGSSTASLGLAAALAALAFLCKHNAVAIPVAIVLWLLLYNKWKQIWVFCGVWALVAGSTLLAFQLSSQGLLLLNLSGAKFGHFGLTYVHDILTRLFAAPGNAFAVALFALGVFGFLQPWDRRSERSCLLKIYLIVALGFAVISSAAAGAATNYYLEPALAMALLIPTGLASLEPEWKNDSPLVLFAAVILIALVAPSLDTQRRNLMHSRPEDLRREVALMKDKRVFTDEPYLAARTSNPQAIDLASLINTERTGGWAAWSSAMIAQALQNKRYELVILRTPMAPPYLPYEPKAAYPRYPRLDDALQVAVIQNYHLCFQTENEEFGPLYFYSPVLDERNPARGCASLKRSDSPENDTHK
jgi:hypothetical protein